MQMAEQGQGQGDEELRKATTVSFEEPRRWSATQRAIKARLARSGRRLLDQANQRHGAHDERDEEREEEHLTVDLNYCRHGRAGTCIDKAPIKNLS